MRTRTMSRDREREQQIPTKRGRERELKIWPRDHVGLENLTSLQRFYRAYKYLDCRPWSEFLVLV